MQVATEAAAMSSVLGAALENSSEQLRTLKQNSSEQLKTLAETSSEQLSAALEKARHARASTQQIERAVQVQTGHRCTVLRSIRCLIRECLDGAGGDKRGGGGGGCSERYSCRQSA